MKKKILHYQKIEVYYRYREFWNYLHNLEFKMSVGTYRFKCISIDRYSLYLYASNHEQNYFLDL